MTTLNVYLERISHNLNFLKSKVSSEVDVIGVVKANAYGHGAIKISKYLNELGVNILAVASSNEGKILRENGIRSKVIVFYPEPYSLENLVKFSLEPAIYSKKIWHDLYRICKKRNIKGFPIHLKFNTGLNRLGFDFEDIDWINNEMKKSFFKIESVYSHLSSSEGKKENEISKSQIIAFEKIRNTFLKINTKIKFHLFNSSGIHNYPEYKYDWVRAGISLYGYANNIDWDKNLLPVAELKTKILQIHKLEKGQVVGYNSGWITKEKTTIATIPIGHADGIGRFYGNSNAAVWINKKKAKIIGNICMDMFMADITEIDCLEGDEVVIFNDSHPASEFAESGGSISYELLSSLGSRVTRNYL